MYILAFITFAFASFLACEAAKATTKSASIHHGFDPSFLSDLSVNRQNTFHDNRYISDAPSALASSVKGDPPMTLVAHHFSSNNQCSGTFPFVTGILFSIEMNY
jgi:hypothetical protein